MKLFSVLRRLGAGPFALVLLVGLLAACEPTPPPGCEVSDDGPPVYSASAPAQASSVCEPPPPCVGCGGPTGDPHISTFDGKRYDLQSAAEVIGARTSDGSFEVQWRQEPVGSSNTSGVTAVAMRVAGSRIMVTDDPAILRIDGDVVEVPIGEAVVLPTGVVVHHVDRQIIVVHEATGSAVHVQLGRLIGVLIDPPDAHEGDMEGLLGDADGDPANDLVFADGQVLSDPTWDDLHPGLAEAWRVVDDNSLFDYEDGKGPDTYWDPTFPARQPTIDEFSAEEQAEAERVCRAAGVSDPGLLTDCIFDVLITGDESMAELFARQQLAAGIALDRGSSSGEPEPGSAASGELDGLTLTEDSRAGHVTGDGVVLVRAEDDDAVGHLLAVDAQTHEIRWSTVDVDVHTRPVVVDGVGIVVRLDPDSADLGDDSNALAVLSLQDGSELTRFVADDVAGGGLIGDGSNTVVLQRGFRLRAFTVTPDEIVPTWEKDLAYRERAIVIDGHLVAEVERSADSVRMETFDLESGDVTSSIDLTGTSLSRIYAVGDGKFMALTNGEPRQLSLIEVDDGQLRLRWSTAEDPNEPDLPDYLVRAGDYVVGWSRHVLEDGSNAQGPIAYEIATGDVAWVYAATSFENNGGMLAGSDDFVVIGTFGGAWAEVMDATDGSQVGILDEPPSGESGEAKKLTALDDGTFMITTVHSSGISLEFISPGE